MAGTIESVDATGKVRPLEEYEKAKAYYSRQVVTSREPEALMNGIVVIELLDVVITNLKRKGA